MEVILGAVAVVALLIVVLSMPGVLREHRIWKLNQAFQRAVVQFTLTTQVFQVEFEKAAEALKNLASSIPVSFSDVKKVEELA